MTSINNSGAVNMHNSCGCNAFAPACSVVYTPSIPNIIIRDTSTYDAGDSAKATVVTITDTQGNFKTGRAFNSGSGCTLGTVGLTSQTVTSVPVSAGGTLYCGGGSGTLNVTFSGGGGSGAAAYAVVTNGVVTSVVVTAAGSGYSSAPTATLVNNTTVISLSGFVAGGIMISATVTSTNGCNAHLFNPTLISDSATLSTTLGDSATEYEKDVQDPE